MEAQRRLFHVRLRRAYRFVSLSCIPLLVSDGPTQLLTTFATISFCRPQNGCNLEEECACWCMYGATWNDISVLEYCESVCAASQGDR